MDAVASAVHVCADDCFWIFCRAHSDEYLFICKCVNFMHVSISILGLSFNAVSVFMGCVGVGMGMSHLLYPQLCISMSAPSSGAAFRPFVDMCVYMSL